jgi:hypothetical protein
VSSSYVGPHHSGRLRQQRSRPIDTGHFGQGRPGSRQLLLGLVQSALRRDLSRGQPFDRAVPASHRPLDPGQRPRFVPLRFSQSLAGQLTLWLPDAHHLLLPYECRTRSEPAP